MNSITIRPITDDEYPAFARALVEGFADDVPDDEYPDLMKKNVPPERTLAAFDGDDIVGTFGGYALDLVVPGGRIPMEGTTFVTVFPTHRRMGLMNEMMARHLDDAVANGFPVAGLWASGSAIYGRYGYGIATYGETVTLASPNIVFRDVIALDRVRRISAEGAEATLAPIFDAVLATRPGMFARTTQWWSAEVLHDASWKRHGKTSLRIVVHDGVDGPDGYAIYRQKDGWGDDGHATGTVHIREVIAESDRAHASLWSYLANVDACPNIRYEDVPIDDPLAMKLLEPRRVMRQSYSDALWILILDVTKALEARRYERDGVLRFTVENAFRNDVEGTFELSVTDGIATCTRMEGEAELAVDLDVLGALYLGGGDAHAYAAANRIRGNTDAVTLLHEFFHTPRAPWCNQVF